MKTKHTLGPWSVLEYQANPDCKKWQISCLRPAQNGCRKNPRIALCEEMGGASIGEDEGRANARLIAAAPELLAALKILEVGCSEASLKHHEKSGTTDKLAENLLQIIREAIAKAEGGA